MSGNVRLRATYIGGPTALIEFGGFRLLTDPTFDPGGTDYPTPVYTLHKTQSPAVGVQEIGAVDGVLLSHDHHFDNLDLSGRAALGSAKAVYTTVAGAERLGANSVGLAPWQEIALSSALRLTATPARHGPEGSDRGPVVGFVMELFGGPTIYVSGDTVWYEGVAEVGRRFRVDVAFLNLGAARVAVAGPANITFTAAEAITLAKAWPGTTIVPLHFEGWTHFSEGASVVRQAFADAGLTSRLHWLVPGVATELG